MIAALFVERDGAYYGIPDVDPWDESRDARLYPGPWPVVAHPPCSRWCRLAGLVEARWGHKRGEDGGCFASALASVRRWGGVLEHPAYSDAWAVFALPAPPLFRGVGARFRRRVDVSRRAGALWARGEEEHMALLLRHGPAIAALGVDSGSLPVSGVLVPQLARGHSTQNRQERSSPHTARVPRPAARHRSECTSARGDDRVKTLSRVREQWWSLQLFFGVLWRRYEGGRITFRQALTIAWPGSRGGGGQGEAIEERTRRR